MRRTYDPGIYPGGWISRSLCSGWLVVPGVWGNPTGCPIWRKPIIDRCRLRTAAKVPATHTKRDTNHPKTVLPGGLAEPIFRVEHNHPAWTYCGISVYSGFFSGNHSGKPCVTGICEHEKPRGQERWWTRGTAGIRNGGSMFRVGKQSRSHFTQCGGG